MFEIKTRRANIQDITQMSFIHARSWRKAYRGLLPDKFLDELEDSKWVDMLKKGMGDVTIKAWVATLENEIVACMSVGGSRYKGYEHQLELVSIYVLPEYWSRGVGSLLIDEVLKYALDNRYREVGLWVLDGNSKAIRFYERHGFINNEDTISCTIGGIATTEKRYVRLIKTD